MQTDALRSCVCAFTMAHVCIPAWFSLCTMSAVLVVVIKFVNPYVHSLRSCLSFGDALSLLLKYTILSQVVHVLYHSCGRAFKFSTLCSLLCTKNRMLNLHWAAISIRFVWINSCVVRKKPIFRINLKKINGSYIYPDWKYLSTETI